jgi:hypothetical protein
MALITQEHENAFRQAFNEFFKGQQNAVSLCMMLLEVSHAWDDIVDGDAISESDVNRVFKYLIYDIPKNPIYLAIPSLPDHMLNVFLRWRDANKLERMDPPEVEKSYMLRAGIYDIFQLIAYYMYGDEWAEEIGPKVRMLYGETIEGLRGELCQIQ